ncbi:Uncharacterised protein [Salmonella enterica subsp. enterica serovar Bovismorbificans]|uniref:Uncharacterized protein n=1 Tax=Salmonella enterica subsp. enterica serovar Bovismorbificans TaxID=58097 RepID=A0A655BVE6_SALET|nr:Uncharacterised protein [Salmonella enterica subsp. enterica serovar Bovismorbificans]
MTVVHAIINAQRLRNGEIATDDINVRALQRRIVQTHRQTGGNIKLE